MGLTAFVLQGLIKLDDSGFNKSLSNAEKNAKGWGDKLSKVGDSIKKLGQVTVAAVGAAAVATGKLVMDAVKVYSEYEQLVGGVETLFGTGGKSLEEYQKSVGITEKSTQKQIDASIEKYNSLQRAQDTVMENAHKAFMTAGVDANTYMETVTSFSASLLQSLGGNTEKAAQVADMAMVDMSDNANKMGTDFQSIQNAYQGFAKQNYTMLDNLKLGYGGTKSEMQRLLKDAEKIQKQQGKNVKYSLNNLSDIYEAIHVVQTEMGITGTTAEEAQKTIQGSTNMMKAAWTNLKIAMVSPNGNIPQAINDLTNSIKAAAKNWVPAIKQGLTGLVSVVKEIAPLLAQELPGLISELLPGLAEGAVTLVTALAQGIIDNIGTLVNAFMQALDGIINALKGSNSPVLNFLGDVLDGLKTALNWIIENKEAVVTAVGAIIAAFTVSKIASFVTALNPLTLILSGIAAIATLIITNWEPIQKFFEDLWAAVSAAATAAWEAIEQWWGDITTSISEAWEAVSTWFDENVWTPISQAFELFWGTISELWGVIIDSISEAWTEVSTWFENNVWTPISTAFESVWGTIEQLWGDIVSGVSEAWTEVSTWFLENVWTPISEAFTEVWSTIEQLWGSIVTSVSEAWSTVSGWFYDNVWKPVSDKFTELWNTISQIWSDVSTAISDAWSKVEGVLAPILAPIQSLFQGVSNVVSSIWEGIKEIFGYDGQTANIGVAVHYSEDGTEHSGGGHSFAKGTWNVPYNMIANLHRGEIVLTASQARRYREGIDNSSKIDYNALSQSIVGAVREGMEGAQVNSYLDGKAVTDVVSRILGSGILARRFA